METKNLKIGITLGLKSNTESIWTQYLYYIRFKIKY